MSDAILIIEGHSEIREISCNRLESRGYQIVGTETISKAQLLMESASFGLIILDINLPDGNGLDFCKMLRDSGNNTPILFLSSRTRDERRKYIHTDIDRVECFIAGGNAYMSKPFDFGELDGEIKTLLEKAQDNVNFH